MHDFVVLDYYPNTLCLYNLGVISGISGHKLLVAALMMLV